MSLSLLSLVVMLQLTPIYWLRVGGANSTSQSGLTKSRPKGQRVHCVLLCTSVQRVQRVPLKHFPAYAACSTERPVPGYTTTRCPIWPLFYPNYRVQRAILTGSFLSAAWPT